MAQLNVVATVVAKPGHAQELEGLLVGLVAPSRKDAGCISYQLHRDLDAPGVFVFYETWASRELLEEHKEKPHFQELKEKSHGVVESMDVKLMEKIG
jgi:quinol monooxygenase YgiN